MDPSRMYLRVPEVASRLAVTPSAVYKMAREGKLPSVRVGGLRSIRIPAAAFEAWLHVHEGRGLRVTTITDEPSSEPIEVSLDQRHDGFRARSGCDVGEYIVAWRSGEIEDTAENADLLLEALALRKALAARRDADVTSAAPAAVA